jgi:hypothetical protein
MSAVSEAAFQHYLLGLNGGSYKEEAEFAPSQTGDPYCSINKLSP